MGDKQQFRVAIVGASGHYYHAMLDVRANRNLSLCAFAPGREDEDISVLSESGLFDDLHIPVFADYSVMLDKTVPDIVVVNPFYFLHSEITLHCLKRGISVLSEKPIALERDALKEVAKACEGTSAKLSLLLEYRCNPRFYTARKLVREGCIGEPVMAYAQKSYKLGQRPWYYKTRTTFGGIIPWVGIHAIDWLMYTTGLDYLGVFASHNNHAADEYPEMEDSAACVFELSNGGRAVMSFDYLRPSGADSHADDRLRLVSTEGVLEIGGSAGDSLILTDKSGVHTPALESPGYGMLADLAQQLADPSYTPLLNTQDALYATQVSLIARESADEMIHLNIYRGKY